MARRSPFRSTRIIPTSSSSAVRTIEATASCCIICAGWQTATELCSAIIAGRQRPLRLLLDRGRDPNKGSKNNPPLHLASNAGHGAIARLLLENGANASTNDCNLRTPLHLASECGHEALVRPPLTGGANTEAIDRSDGTALHMATEKGHSGVVRTLLEAGADIEAKADFGGTSLHLATQRGGGDVVRMLLAHGADIDCTDKRRRTALHLVSANGPRTLARPPLQRGAEIAARDDCDETARHMAADKGHLSLVKLLLDKRRATASRRRRCTAQPEWAARASCGCCSSGARDWTGLTAQHLTSGKGREDIMSLLLAKGADAKIKDGLGKAAMHIAARKGYLPVDFREEDATGKLPVNLAPEAEHKDVAALPPPSTRTWPTSEAPASGTSFAGPDGGDGRHPSEPSMPPLPPCLRVESGNVLYISYNDLVESTVPISFPLPLRPRRALPRARSHLNSTHCTAKTGAIPTRRLPPRCRDKRTPRVCGSCRLATPARGVFRN